MPIGSLLAKNITFWHWYPELLLKGLSHEQLRWQPEGHDTSALFATWHAYRSTDEIVHGLVIRRPTVFSAGGWASRLPVAVTGATAFGNGMTRVQIGALELEAGELCAYARAVGESINRYLAETQHDELTTEIALPFFTGVYPNVDRLSRLEAITFFAIGHVSEHLGEVQMVKGLMGLRGAPL